MEYKDYYKTLGVEKSASQEEIKASFRKLARKFHPDVAAAADASSAEAKFKELNEAYEVLGDPAKRKEYDALGPGWSQGGIPRGPAGGRQPGGGFEYEFSGTGFSDFFEMFFGGGSRHAGGGFAGRGGGPRFDGLEVDAGHDVEADIVIKLEEAFHGALRKISFRRHGSDHAETYEIKIPAGIREGQRIRLAGRGDKRSPSGPTGDLYLNVRYERHPFFRIENGDLFCEVPLAPWEAVLGCGKDVSTFEGTLRLKVPPGTQPAQKFRFRNRGMKKKSGGRGDLYAVADIEIPRKPSPAQLEAWRSLAKLE